MTYKQRLTPRDRAVPPKKDLAITITITETTEGKLGIHAQIPDHATGTVAMVLTEQVMGIARELMNRALGVNHQIEEGRLQ